MRQGAGMPAPAPLPEPFREGAWSVDEARWAGVPRQRLRRRDLFRVHHGMRATREGVGALTAYLPLLRPGDRVSHTTAAELYGTPLPLVRQGQLHVTAGPGLTRPRRPGIRGASDDGRGSATVGGVPVSTPEECFLELAGMLGRDDLVAAGDFLVLDPRFPEPGRPWTTLERLESAAAEPGRRHVRAARAALALVRPGVESRQETRLRLLLTDAGLPEPACGYPVHGVDGRVIGVFDQAWPRHRVLGEYDGDQHRISTIQYEKDIRRFDAAAEAGWTVIRVRARGLGDGSRETVARFRRALRDGSRRP